MFMTTKQQLVERDLYVLGEMCGMVAEYLKAEATHWAMPGDLPKMTLGGCLMRVRRLRVMGKALPVSQFEQFQMLVKQFDEDLMTNVGLSMRRMHQEVHVRLGRWSEYLGNMHSQMVADPAYYVTAVDARLVIEELVDRLQERPFSLAENVQTELTVLDNNLRQRWQAGSFVWDLFWRPAYARDKYWWLYGQPKI